MIAVASIWALAWCLADRSLHLPPSVRWAALWMGTALAVGVGAWQASLCVTTPDWLAVSAEIERRTSAFAERLQTVISGLADVNARSASPAMLRQVLGEVESITVAGSAVRLVGWKRVAPPWYAVLGAMVLFLALWSVPTLGMSRLMARLLHPGQPIEPVTFTRLEVAPKNTEIPPNGSVTISAVAAGSQLSMINARGLELFLSADGRAWSRAVMNPVSVRDTESRFAFSLPSIDRDLRYYVRGGDAKSDEYHISVKHIPAAANFRIRYSYPAYTGHAPLVVTNTDGLIEGLVGCQVNFIVKATEPLSSATLTMDGQRLDMMRGPGDSEWQTQFSIWGNGTSTLDMVSTAGVVGHGPTPMVVRALPDRDPVTQIQQPTGDLRLSSAERLTLHFSASDDYGLKSVEIMARLNDRFPQVFNIPVVPRSLRREGEFTFDLGVLRPTIGDQVSFRLRAEDFGGHVKTGELRQVLIAPISVTSKAYARAAELKRLARLIAAWQEQLIKAKEAVEATRNGDPRNVKQDMWLKANRTLATAVDTIPLRQALLRVLVRTESVSMGWFIQTTVDESMSPPIEPGRVLSAATRADDALMGRLTARINRARELGDLVNVLLRGEQARLAIDELENMRVISASPMGGAVVAELRARALERAGRTIEMILRELSLTPGAGKLAAQLKEFVAKESGVLTNARGVDVGAAVAEWSDRMRRSNVSGVVFSARLQAMSLVESLRPGGDMVWARDLQLLSRAVAGVGMAVAQARDADRGRARSPTKEKTFDPLSRLVQQAGTLLHDRTHATEARAELAKVVAEPTLSDAVELLVFEANAASIEGPDRSSALDEKFEAEVSHISQDEASMLTDDLAEFRRQIDVTGDMIRRVATVQAAMGRSEFTTAMEQMQSIVSGIGALEAANRSNVAAQSYRGMSGGFLLPGSRPLLASHLHRPLLVARWNADRATESLNSIDRRPDVRTQITAYIREILAALQLEQSSLIRASDERRLEEVPSLASLFAPYAADEGILANLAGGWPRYGTKFHEALRAGSDLEGHRETDPAGYQEQLKTYFDAVNRAQQGRRP
jgi:hypothetical protein